ncbi:MAG: hypothetical protein JW908_12790 [Anaerolineales bacterium]|nr:hypothetical protein [Anaerolineales bacterium]
MVTFNYITDEEFRRSLESDYSELISCIENKAYKSAHVLSGSIIEAILIDYLISVDLVEREEALKMDFGKAIKVCLDNNIISVKTRDLCSVIKGYRNLIHPGRMIRLSEKVGIDSASVAKSLVSIVIEEVEIKRLEKYGYTAEQIVSKIENDASAKSIIPNLLSELNTSELERLMLKILPKQCLDLTDDVPKHIIPAYIYCFDTAFNLSSDEIKKRVANNLAKTVKEESGDYLIAYGTFFISPSYFKYMTEDNYKIVKKYLLNEFVEFFKYSQLKGIGEYIESEEDIALFTNAVVSTFCLSDNDTSEQGIKRFFIYESTNMEPGIIELIEERLNLWIKLIDGKEDNIVASKVHQLLSLLNSVRSLK